MLVLRNPTYQTRFCLWLVLLSCRLLESPIVRLLGRAVGVDLLELVGEFVLTPWNATPVGRLETLSIPVPFKIKCHCTTGRSSNSHVGRPCSWVRKIRRFQRRESEWICSTAIGGVQGIAPSNPGRRWEWGGRQCTRAYFMGRLPNICPPAFPSTPDLRVPNGACLF